MPQLHGLAALVTGGASGIGLATVNALHAAGARVACLDIQERVEINDVVCLRGDVTDQDSVDAAVRAVVNELGRLDVVVNNAGVGAVGTVEDNTDDEWWRVLNVNLLGMVRTSRGTLPHLRRSPEAAIVNVCSVAAKVGLIQRACYSASKGAVLSLTLAMAADLLDDGIRVNCVTPGTIDTPWVGRLLANAKDSEAERSALEERQPMGRLGTAEEVASAIVFLASPRSSFITGVALPVDGGMERVRVSRACSTHGVDS